MSKSPSSNAAVRRRGFSKNVMTKAGTILRAVPQAKTTPPLLPPPVAPVERPVSPNQEILINIGRPSPTSPPGKRSSSSVPLPSHPFLPHAARPRASSNGAMTVQGQYWSEGKAVVGPSDPQTIIGVYKHGQIEWQPPTQKSDLSKQHRRPKIEVIIPKDPRDRPFPSSPFFPTHSIANIRSAAAEFGMVDDVSPPSGKNSRVRDSMVSPLSSQAQRPARQIATFQKYELLCRPDHSTNKNSVSRSNSSNDSPNDDASSVYSQRSSMTSVAGDDSPARPQSANLRNRPGSGSPRSHSSSPRSAGVSNADAPETTKSEPAETDVHLSAAQLHRRYAPHPSLEHDQLFQPTCTLGLSRDEPHYVSRQRRSSGIRRRSHRHSRNRRSLDSNPDMGFINQAIARVEANMPPSQKSPTLSEAEVELEKQLTEYLSLNGAANDAVEQADSSDDGLYDPPPKKEVIQPESPPALPRKSSKRVSQLDHPEFRLSRVPNDHIASQFKKERARKSLTINIPSAVSERTEDWFLSPIPVPVAPPRLEQRTIAPDVAEHVILRILQSLEQLDELFATAVVNRGFYRVFKRHELELMKSVLRRMSPPAWEHREICYPGHDQEDPDMDLPRLEYTPTNYLQFYQRDLYIICALKSLIKDKCASFLRPEMAVALVSLDERDCRRVDDALWRIWTFCKIFGCGKGREEDIVAQIDWLKGGELVHQKTTRATLFTVDSLDTSEALANAPECFALGNEGGLTAEQLYDMMELWNCLGVLLQPFEGRTIQAREYGVYDNTDVRGGDIDGEEAMLVEWYYYLLTLGLSPILDLATPCRQADPSAFIKASDNGWMDWTPPPMDGSRRNFLKEAASRVYEEKIAMVYASSNQKDVQRQLSKQRMERYRSEIRRRKNSGDRMPEIRMSQERPMSEWENVMDRLTAPRPPLPSSNIVSHIPSLRSEAPNSRLPHESVPEPSAAAIVRPISPPRRIVAEPLLPTPPPSTVPSHYAPSIPSFDEHPAFRSLADSRPGMPSLAEHPAFRELEGSIPEISVNEPAPSSSSSPSSEAEIQHLQNQHPAYRAHHTRQISSSRSMSSIEEHPAFQQHPRQQQIFSSNVAENTADKAVYRIVEMGFTPDQARYALRMTDIGDGLRVDRAVEMLLREMS